MHVESMQVGGELMLFFLVKIAQSLLHGELTNGLEC